MLHAERKANTTPRTEKQHKNNPLSSIVPRTHFNFYSAFHSGEYLGTEQNLEKKPTMKVKNRNYNSC